MKGKRNLSHLPAVANSADHLPTLNPSDQSLARKNLRLEGRVSDLEDKLRVALQRLDALESHTSLEKYHFSRSRMEIGILGFLRLTSYSPYERRFSVSQSSAELYAIIDPSCENYYGSPDKGDAWIQFDFPHEITVFGFLIQSYLSCFVKSYRIVSISSNFSEQVIFATNSEIGLQGELKEVTHVIDPPVKTRYIRFEQTGKSWSDKNFIGVKRIDFQTDQLPGYYLENLMKQYDRDPHKVPINITSKYFDPYSFILQNPSSYVCTFDAPIPAWFQIELLYGKAVVNGYRLRRHEALKLRAWSLRGSNDSSIGIDEWTVIHSVCERTSGELLTVYDFEGKGPYKYFRLVMDQPGWNDRTYLAFWHFDLFGDYLMERM
jgi:hypothetical protein